jgi:hypothetical protein
MSMDPVNMGADLPITQLFRKGMVGATWPRIHPHGHLPLMERLNLAAKKGLQEVRACQPSMPYLLNDLTQRL